MPKQTNERRSSSSYDRSDSCDSGEFKVVDAYSTITADTSTSVALLNGIAPGTGLDQRVGRQVTMRSVQLKYAVNPTTSTNIADQIVRVVLVHDKQPNGTACAATDVLQYATVFAPRNVDNRRRFTILYDRTHYINSYGETGSGTNIQQYYHRLRHPVIFNSGSAGTVADIVTGSMYLIVLGTYSPGASASNVSYYSRIRFTDN